MWTLLRAAAQPQPNDDRVVERARHNGTTFSSPPQSASRNGTGPTPATTDESPQEVRIFMHPGRLELGVVDFDRAAAQFDLHGARKFASLKEAEPACAGRSGFLLELSSKDRRRGSAVAASVLFVERLRR
jgi:hypothetical protein